MTEHAGHTGLVVPTTEHEGKTVACNQDESEGGEGVDD